MDVILGLAIAAGALWFLVYLDRAGVRRRQREDEDFRKQIAHLPFEQQVGLWLSKLRRDTERDWF